MSYETNSESIRRIFKMIDAKAPELLKQDPYHEYKKTAEEAIEKGLIRKKTQEEIDAECAKKPWLKVNKIIRKNEELYGDADTSV
jgi:ATP-dependent protease ClpP protease subunit